MLMHNMESVMLWNILHPFAAIVSFKLPNCFQRSVFVGLLWCRSNGMGVPKSKGKKDAITIHLVKIFIQRNGDLSFNLIVNMVAQKESEKRVMLFIHVKKEKLSLVFN